ncbi:unnamed protein product [Oppiella nova]|uniref:Pyridoxine 5'-phosphate synthase n=1 Tax=Oppiella nova TaxID=334625 RepID=A0A7R9L8X2_9ACAR|nr:unnamed protein product [Oppiella nova]CAG2160070.1 unnamed protein product [Oppiella nova]
MNLEIAVTDEMVAFAKEIQPHHVCFVPEKRQEITTEGGLDVLGHFEDVKAATQALTAIGCDVSLFIDADFAQIDAAIACGAPTIELHTGAYADAKTAEAQQIELERIIKGTEYAASKGLVVNAGHGLNLDNVAAIAAIPQIHELNIGHSIIAESVFVGLEQAVKDMKAALHAAGCETPKAWLDEALNNLPLLMQDHANCEKKAAGTAMNLMFRYSFFTDLQIKLAQLVREEMLHYEQVLEFMTKRGQEWKGLSAGRYAGDDELGRYYRYLLKSESRHYEDYLTLALDVAKTAKLKDPEEDIQQRIELIREVEKDLILTPDKTFRFHSDGTVALSSFDTCPACIWITLTLYLVRCKKLIKL